MLCICETKEISLMVPWCSQSNYVHNLVMARARHVLSWGGRTRFDFLPPLIYVGNPLSSIISITNFGFALICTEHTEALSYHLVTSCSSVHNWYLNQREDSLRGVHWLSGYDHALLSHIFSCVPFLVLFPTPCIEDVVVMGFKTNNPLRGSIGGNCRGNCAYESSWDLVYFYILNGASQMSLCCNLFISFLEMTFT